MKRALFVYFLIAFLVNLPTFLSGGCKKPKEDVEHEIATQLETLSFPETTVDCIYTSGGPLGGKLKICHKDDRLMICDGYTGCLTFAVTMFVPLAERPFEKPERTRR